MAYSISEKINPNRVPREPFGLKAEASLNRVTLNPSSASPGETLYVNIPKLSENVVILPGSVYLIFKLEIDGHPNNYFVNNLSRNLVNRLKVRFGGETLQDTHRYDLFQTYQDLFLPTEDRIDGLRRGISDVNMRKLRANAKDKNTGDSVEVALAAIHEKNYCIQLDHPILNDHGALYPRALSHDIKFEITLPDISDVVIHPDLNGSYTKDEEKKKPSYKITNLELEYQCIRSEHLASQAAESYQVGKVFFYENVMHLKEFNISKTKDELINEHINIPRRSMTGILLLFTSKHMLGARKSEKFVNPDITSVNINIDGMPNKLYSKGMIESDFWEAAKRRFGKPTDTMKEKNFYENKFCLWIDLRTFYDNSIHGNGFHLNNTRDGVKLEIKRKTSGSGSDIVCNMFAVADAVMEIMNSNLHSIKY